VYARWLDYPGEQLVNMVEVEIGGQRIDRQYGDWMHIWNQLTLTSECERGYNKMVGQTTELTYLTDPEFANVDSPCAAEDVPGNTCAPRNALPETTLYVPLQFWFCRNPGLAIPLIALQYHEVKINLELNPIDQCLYAVQGVGSAQSANAGSDIKVTRAYQQSLVAASLYVDYVFLDTDERRRMAQNPHEYLIEQLQFTGDESIGSAANRIKLNFNHPCKELVWVVQPDAHVDYCSQTVEGALLQRALGAQPFNYTDAVDALPNSIRAFSGSRAVQGGAAGQANNDFITASGLFQDPLAEDVSFTTSHPSNVNQEGLASATGTDTGLWTDQQSGSSVSDAGAFVLAESALNMHCWGQNPVVTAKLQLNGQDRFSEREGTYFDLVQPYQHHTRNPDTGIKHKKIYNSPQKKKPKCTINKKSNYKQYNKNFN
jgi:hypothetical protein